MRRADCIPEGVAAQTQNFPGTDLSPSPNFELTAQACGAYAARVEDPGELPDALAKALKVVKEEQPPGAAQCGVQESVDLSHWSYGMMGYASERCRRA